MHRTARLNEMSGRYSEMPEEFYTPEKWRGQSTSNKQCSEGVVDYTPGIWEQNQEFFLSAEEAAFSEYHRRLEAGVSRELARTCLPLSTFTVWYWQIDLHNLMHFLGLRLEDDAQYEIKVYADEMYKMAKTVAPLAVEAFEDYQLHGVHFSRMEMELVRRLLSHVRDLDLSDPKERTYIEETLGSKREADEFIKKLRLQ